MLKHWKRTLSLLAVAAAIGLTCVGLALGKKPPKPPPDPDPDPPEVTVRYSIDFFGPLPGDDYCVPLDVNNWGEVVGTSRLTGVSFHAFVYNSVDGMARLHDLMSDEDKALWDYLYNAKGINDAGQIVGLGILMNGQARAYRFTPGVDGAPAVVENLGTLGGDSSASDINDQGEVVGQSVDHNGAVRAFVYTDADGDGTEEMVDIGDLGGNWATAYAINNYGQVTGESRRDASSFRSYAFRYTPGVGGLPCVMEDLGDLGPYKGSVVGESTGKDINDDGHVVGSVIAGSHKGRPTGHAFLYTDHMIDLGTLGGVYSGASSINSSGHVVGWSEETDKNDARYGFLYTDNTDTGEFVMVKLQGLIPVGEEPGQLPPDFQGEISARKISDLGHICGSGDGQAYLLTPVSD